VCLLLSNYINKPVADERVELASSRREIFDNCQVRDNGKLTALRQELGTGPVFDPRRKTFLLRTGIAL
jgi:hypothetical protein